MLAVGLTLKDQASVNPQILSSQVGCVCNSIQWIIADECIKERGIRTKFPLWREDNHEDRAEHASEVG